MVTPSNGGAATSNWAHCAQLLDTAKLEHTSTPSKSEGVDFILVSRYLKRMLSRIPFVS